MATTLFTNVRILDSTGAAPYDGEVLVSGDRIAEVRKGAGDLPRDGAEVVDGRGGTLMSGLCDAHTHFSWNNGDLAALGPMPVEEHVLHSMKSARTYIDYGYTMCVGAASAKERLDVVMRNAIDAGDIPGPRYLANGKEIATTGGDLIGSITQFADGPEEMRKVVRRTIGLGVDMIKLSMSGEEITGTQRAEDNYFTDEEVAMAVKEAHNRGIRVAVHARSADSVKIAVRNGVDIVYHASYVDAEGLDMLEAEKDRIFVAPGINWLYASLNEAEPYGYPRELAIAQGYERELAAAIAGLKEMKRRGIRLLPGGDYGFAWTPHGTYARDLEHFVTLLGFTPMEAILSATALGGEIMLRPDELGKVAAGYKADLILVDGDPLGDITVLQDITKIVAVMKDGNFHRQPPAAIPASPISAVPAGPELVTS
ncbi:MAG TPA: amidohydrolase family protein [Mycobacteriales bacterium]|jgi:imidazolonepropionase-like amidohydrolase|nr:amidohydrolase family protein [Mycobacteriales bacterium]